MKFKNIFFSPSVIPFLNKSYKKDKLWIIHIIYRNSGLDKIHECTYCAKNICDLHEKLRELNRVQVTMGIRINSSLDTINTEKAFLIYKPIIEKYRIENDQVILNDNSQKLTIKTTRWIRHKKKDFSF